MATLVTLVDGQIHVAEDHNGNLYALNTELRPPATGGLGIRTVPANGQVPIGNGTGYTVATLTAGSNIALTNAAGSITVAATSSYVGSGTDTAITNSSTETTVVSTSIAASALGTENIIEVLLTAKFTNTTGAAQGYTHRFKYGAQTLVTQISSTADGSTNQPIILFGYLAADGSATSQLGFVAHANPSNLDLSRGVSTVASTSAQNLVVTFQWDVANAALSYTLEHFSLWIAR